MSAALLERLGRPITIVVGKGGVGKTTTAGAIALALADRGEATHLLSTDPAHSLGDLFGQALSADPTPSACTDRLLLEELDAARAARARIERLEPALLEVIDRGTYLDEDDARSLLDAALPGLDEIGAALRVAELARTGGRLVVDTAPTGHTLRLLDSEHVVRGWIEVFRTMAEKADAVASALVRRTVRLGAENELDQLARQLGDFSASIRDADFVVVTGPGAVVAAETDRLLGALRDRGLTVTATVAAARPGARADILLPVRSGLAGCQALRGWWTEEGRDDHPVPALTGSRAGRSPAESAPWPLPAALDRELVVVTGKGGVGKTTCAAALAVRLADDGAVALLGSDPAGSLADVIGEPVPGLTVMEADAEAELERFKDRYRAEVESAFAAIGLDHAARLDQRVMESLWGAAPPGIDELVAIGRMADELDSSAASDPTRSARIVLDTAPTGHFLRLMAMPDLALDWVHRIMRILLKYRAAGGLDAQAGALLRLAKQLRALRARLSDPSRTSIVVVTVEEPLVGAETCRLLDRLRQFDLPTTALVVNRWQAGGTGVSPAARSPVGRELPVFRAPLIAEPTGAGSLADFLRSWERVP